MVLPVNKALLLIEITPVDESYNAGEVALILALLLAFVKYRLLLPSLILSVSKTTVPVCPFTLSTNPTSALQYNEPFAYALRPWSTVGESIGNVY